MAREGSKRQIAIEIMNANADKPMAEVMALISAANNFPLGHARGYYVYLVKQGMAKGTVDATRTPRAKAEKAPKAEGEVAAPKAPVVAEKSAEEIEKIKAANMARLKEVQGRYKQKVKKSKAGEEPTIEADPFAAPAALTMDEVTALV